jgi:predicted enzyme related to lactoylglutathione lyase
MGRTLLLTPDMADARQFYGALLGWQLPEFGSPAADRGFLGATAPVRAGGCEVAAMLCSTPALRSRLPRPTWLPSVHVASLDDSLASAWALGATILLDDAVVPGLGRLGLIQDPTGAALALLESVGSGRQ